MERQMTWTSDTRPTGTQRPAPSRASARGAGKARSPIDPLRREEILRAYLGHARRFEEIASKLHRRAALPAGEPEVVPRDAPAAEPRRVTALSAREQVVLGLVAEGLSNRQIGLKLHISEETVKTHVQHILRGLDARNRAHAVSLGFSLGLLRTS
jgi:DNA-binding NarL/FixJ family response regulator